VDEFMKECGRLFEIVVFTASLATYADAVLDLLDIHHVVDWRLFRESCSSVKGTYIKDLARMGRPIEEIIIIDNSPHSYAFNPLNAIPVQTWFDDQSDNELQTLVPILERLAQPTVRDVKVELQMILEISGVDLINNAFSNVTLCDQQSTEIVPYNDDTYQSETSSEEGQDYSLGQQEVYENNHEEHSQSVQENGAQYDEDNTQQSENSQSRECTYNTYLPSDEYYD